jgi:basic amino acid/polyamine antiporter, APA family
MAQQSPPSTSPKAPPGLVPTLGLFTTVAMISGSIIGSGVFRKPALMAGQLGSPELLIGIWVLAGLLTLFGALTNAEIAGMLSATGGQYVFFQKIYGDFTAYLYGWAVFAVIQTGSIASIAYVFGDYTQYFVTLPRFSTEIEQASRLYIPFIGNIFPLENIGVKLVTICTICLLTGVNYLGVRFGGIIQGVFTSLKLIAMFFLVVMAFTYSGGSMANFVTSAPNSPASQLHGIELVFLIVTGLAGAFWTYDGWNSITYIAGEIKNPHRTIPRALFIAMMIVIATYVSINLAYLYVMPIEAMAKSTLVAADVAKIVLGAAGGTFIAAAVMTSTFGTTNGTILASARVYYAMAHDNRFFKSSGTIHPRFHTPGNALVLQSVWTCVLVLSGTFDTLTDMLIFVTWIFYAMGAFGVFILRKRMPDSVLEKPRPYKVFGYPFVPAIFVGIATIYVFLTLYNDVTAYMQGKTPIINSVFGLFLVATGLPFYYYFKSRASKETSASADTDAA